MVLWLAVRCQPRRALLRFRRLFNTAGRRLKPGPTTKDSDMRLLRFSRHPLSLLAGSVIALGALAAPALADASWDKNKGDCDEAVFAAPADAPDKKLTICVHRWATYRKDVKSVKGDYKARVVRAITRLYVIGDNEDAVVSKKALAALGVTELPERGGAAAAATPARPKMPAREKYTPPKAEIKEKAKAERHFSAGLKYAKKKKYEAALKEYRKMVDVAPGWSKSHYNVACMQSLLEDEKGMLESLRNLADMASNGDREAGDMLRLTWKDEDFGKYKGTTSFKEVTGYATIRIVNEVPDLDEDNPFNLEGSLKKLGYDPELKDADKQSHKHPVIYYAPHARTVAFIVRKLVKHPKTVVEQHDAEALGGLDVVIRWSDNLKKEQSKVYIEDPKDAEEALDDLARKQDEILSQPEDAVDEMNETLGKPGEVQDSIEENLERPGKAVERVEKTIDKLKNPFK